jgi:hypothetical protein
MKGAIGNKSDGGVEPNNSDDENPTVNTLSQTEDVSVKYIFSLKINDKTLKKTDKNCCHKDFR